jgi:hypothetical protein
MLLLLAYLTYHSFQVRGTIAMSSSPTNAQFVEPPAALSLPFIVFSHADHLIRMTIGGSIDPKSLGPLHRQHDVDAVLLQFNTGRQHSPAVPSDNVFARS